jgi:hypothetical protein
MNTLSIFVNGEMVEQKTNRYAVNGLVHSLMALGVTSYSVVEKGGVSVIEYISNKGNNVIMELSK